MVYGGYFYNVELDSLSINVGLYRGGVIFINFTIKNSIISLSQYSTGALTLITGKIINNTTNGALIAAQGGSYFTNLLIAHNYAVAGTLVKGATYTGIATNLTIINNLGVTHAGVVNVPVINSVVWGNRIDGLKENFYTDSGVQPSYSAFENEVVAGTANVNISVNNEGDVNSPKFVLVAPTIGNTVDDFDYDIQNGSFLIDKGNNAYPSNGDGSIYDTKGRQRKVDTVDIGCYENQKL